MRLNEKARETIRRLQLILDLDSEKDKIIIDNLEKFFIRFMLLIIFDFIENKSTYIPYIGNLEINSLMLNNELNINANFILDEAVIQLIQQHKNEENILVGNSYIVNYLKTEIEQILKNSLYNK